MLTEINCEHFRTPKIIFHQGLNVVLGDENAANSIGKSSLLMIIDFVFGGNDFPDKNRDAIDELGHLDIYYSFLFGGDKSYFHRSTLTPQIVSICDRNYDPVKDLSLSEYTSFLHSHYKLPKDISFRSYVSLYSRVWPKDSSKLPEIPFHTHKTANARDSIDNTIKRYGKYSDIKLLDTQLKTVDKEKKALTSAFKNNLIRKITKTVYKENMENISVWESEYTEIKNDLARFAVSVQQIISQEILELKTELDSTIETKQLIDDKLRRTQQNINGTKFSKSHGFNNLIEFFPNINSTRLEKIETFHHSITNILSNELKQAEELQISQSNELDKELKIINENINAIHKSTDVPSVIIDKVSKLTNKMNKANDEVYYHDRSESLRLEYGSKRDQKENELAKVTEALENKINEGLRSLTQETYGKDGKPPRLSLLPDKYKYELFEDTGTGKTYAILLLLDLTIFSQTSLPFLIHDTVLFKNVENPTVANIISQYINFERQTFIALDEIKKYGTDTEKLLQKNSVIQLANNNTLFIKDWRKDSK